VTVIPRTNLTSGFCSSSGGGAEGGTAVKPFATVAMTARCNTSAADNLHKSLSYASRRSESVINTPLLFTLRESITAGGEFWVGITAEGAHAYTSYTPVLVRIPATEAEVPAELQLGQKVRGKIPKDKLHTFRLCMPRNAENVRSVNLTLVSKTGDADLYVSDAFAVSSLPYLSPPTVPPTPANNHFSSFSAFMTETIILPANKNSPTVDCTAIYFITIHGAKTSEYEFHINPTGAAQQYSYSDEKEAVKQAPETGKKLGVAFKDALISFFQLLFQIISFLVNAAGH
jgi:hypothetical protein